MTKDKSLHLTPKQLGLEDNPMIPDMDPLASDKGNDGHANLIGEMLAAMAPFAKYFATYSKTFGYKSLRPMTGPIFGLNAGSDDAVEITVEDFKAIVADIAKAERS